MNDHDLDNLLARARRAAPAPTPGWLETGFETRVRARLAADKPAPAFLDLFGNLSWRLLPAFAAIALSVLAWTGNPATLADDLADASIDNDNPEIAVFSAIIED